MWTSIVPVSKSSTSAEPGNREDLRAALDQAAEILPTKPPGGFIHCNTLHAFQHMPFERAVAKAGALYGAEPYLREDAFRLLISTGRIREVDIDSVLEREPNREILRKQLDRRMLRKCMLLPGVRHFNPAVIEWQMTEEGLADALRPDLPEEAWKTLTAETVPEVAARRLFAECQKRVMPTAMLVSEQLATRPRDALFAKYDTDIDQWVHPLLIRLCSEFLDQAESDWPILPRGEGLYKGVRELLMRRSTMAPRYFDGLEVEFRRQHDHEFSSEDVVADLLEQLAVAPKDWAAYITAELLALPGWAGMIRRLEKNPELGPHAEGRCSLMDFMAVRLSLVAVAARNLGGGQIPAWRGVALDRIATPDAERLCKVAELFDVTQLAGISANDLRSLSLEQWRVLDEEISQFDDVERRRVLQLAYENCHDHQVLAPLAANRSAQGFMQQSRRPAAQVLCCIDNREESLRRRLEEIAPEIETYGYTGLFGIDIGRATFDEIRSAMGWSERAQADHVEKILRLAGLNSGFSRLVVILGHGPTPSSPGRKSVHDCGACGGRNSGSNARLLAKVMNEEGVREILSERGVVLPEDTIFVGGWHDTSRDRIELFDLDAIPGTHSADVDRIQEEFRSACVQEMSARTGPFDAGCGHAANAICVVGRRSLTRGLCLDRMAFLVSYDASQDSDDAVLANVLSSAVPICAGINLDYYFSFVDNEKYGCGTRVTRESTGLLSIPAGSSSDLRTGLPWRIVEPHDPVRLLFVIESTPERIAKTFQGSAELTEFLENRWIRLATIDPEDGSIHIYRGSHFEKVEQFEKEELEPLRSPALAQGRREHLALARIVSRGNKVSAA